jgi:hypothetical protein
MPHQTINRNPNAGPAANRQNTTHGLNEDALDGKMICTKDKASDMPETSKDRYDLTEEGSKRGDEKATRIAREQGTDRENGNAPMGNVAEPKKDDMVENRVTTSLSDE